MAEPWWQSAVVYQIYPRSFADSNGDGIGDLRGVLDHLDYLQHLGVDVVWLSPIYASPQQDNGYDISDYRRVDPIFGSEDDLDDLIAGLHGRGMRLVMDLVVNHTSSEHEWFQRSRSSRDDPLRDWYLWRPPRPGRVGGTPGAEPNDWTSAFSGPAWTWDEATGEYYLHLFSSGQPDLNWDNPEVRGAVHEMMRWWLRRGIDGFRMDVINFISKDPLALTTDGTPFSGDGPRLHDYLQELRREVFDAVDGAWFTVGEMPGATLTQAQLATAPERRELDMIFQFEHVQLDHNGSKWQPHPVRWADLTRSLAAWQDGLAERGWNSLYFENHDQPRSVSRWASDGELRERAAKTLATILHLQRGTPFIYQGQELGMTNTALASRDDLRDIEAVRHYDELVAAGTPAEEAMSLIRPMCRDHARTPMQWTADDGAGFCIPGVVPWLGINPNHRELNAADQVSRPDSVFGHYRRLIQLRHEHAVVRSGAFHLLEADHEQLFCFTRTLGEECWLVMANVSDRPAELTAGVRDLVREGFEPILGTEGPAAGTPTVLQPWESLVVALGRRVTLGDGAIGSAGGHLGSLVGERS
ncbi:MAG: alpha-glucosidase [Propionibacteriaceae bacterium]|nr:alpha-glucosidase [Propionibacteriaceae bacterium]